MIDLHGHVVAAVLVGDDFRILPHVAEPLPVGEVAALGPRDEALRGLDDTSPLIRIEYTDVGHRPRLQLAHDHLEAVGVFAGRESLEQMARVRRAQGDDENPQSRATSVRDRPGSCNI